MPGVFTYAVSFDPCDSPGRCAYYPGFIDKGTTQAQGGPASGHIDEQATVPELKHRSVCDRAGFRCLPLCCLSFLWACGRAEKNRLFPSESSAGREGHMERETGSWSSKLNLYIKHLSDSDVCVLTWKIQTFTCLTFNIASLVFMLFCF